MISGRVWHPDIEVSVLKAIAMLGKGRVEVIQL